VEPLQAGQSERSIPSELTRRLKGLKHLVGNTPLLEIEVEFRGRRRRIHAKAEHVNLTGSIKDRMALHILREGYRRGELTPGAPIVEATSGNTGIAVAGVGRVLGHPVTIFMPDWMSRERIDLIRSLGATIHLVSKQDGGFLGSIDRAEAHASATADAFLPRQFTNRDNVAAHHTTTGPELWWQLRHHGLFPDAFVAGVGTGGTVMGVGSFLRETRPGVRIHPVEPANSPTLSTGHRVGKHRIQGISDEFIPSIVDLGVLDEIVAIDDGDAILMAQRLAGELGIGVGISSGANFLAALLVQERMGDDAIVATVFADDNKKYLSTDLLRDEPVRAGYLSPDVRLLGFDAFKRVCRTCCDPDDCAETVTPAKLEGDPEHRPSCPLWRASADG
jgi:cysteine synthase A